MLQVRKNQEARRLISKVFQEVNDIVVPTMGAKGLLVALDDDLGKCTLTDDGVTVARQAIHMDGMEKMIAVDMIEAMLGLSKRNIEKAYNYEKPKNLFLIRANVEQICDVFDTCDNISRIYINFCNPWPKKKHNKKRLTHPRQLESYKSFLVNKGEIYFKTDSDELFEASKEYLKECSFSIISETYDLHNDDIFGNNIETEHEKMFSEEGIKIKALIAVYNKDN